MATQTSASEHDPLVLAPTARRLYFGGVNRSTLAEWIRAGKLPQPICLTPKTRGWRKSTLDRFLDDRTKGAA